MYKYSQEEIKSIAAEIKRQLLVSVDKNVLMSWGINCHGHMVINGYPAFGLLVNGRLHAGWILIALDEGSDTYKIFFKEYNSATKKYAEEAKCICEECFCDNFADIIDTYIEVGPDRNEYERFCEEERRKLFNGELC